MTQIRDSIRRILHSSGAPAPGRLKTSRRDRAGKLEPHLALAVESSTSVLLLAHMRLTRILFRNISQILCFDALVLSSEMDDDTRGMYVKKKDKSPKKKKGQNNESLERQSHGID